MPRRARIVAPGLAHHVTQRGNNQQNIFDTDFDRKLFLELLGSHASKHKLAIWGYCLMANHFHLIALPETEDSLARTLCRLLADYARYLNVRRGANGHLWQARYYSTPMDERYRWRALAYVERNPVRAGIVREAWEYPWSSAGARLGRRTAPEWLQLSEWHRHWTSLEWTWQLAHGGREPAFAKELKDATLRGHPLGGELTDRLEQALGIRIRPGIAGRPRERERVKASGQGSRF